MKSHFFIIWIPVSDFGRPYDILGPSKAPRGAGLFCPPVYTFHSRSCASTYKYWMAQVGWLVLCLILVYLETRELNPRSSIYDQRKIPLHLFDHWIPETRNLHRLLVSGIQWYKRCSGIFSDQSGWTMLMSLISWISARMYLYIYIRINTCVCVCVCVCVVIFLSLSLSICPLHRSPSLSRSTRSPWPCVYHDGEILLRPSRKSLHPCFSVEVTWNWSNSVSSIET